jgi:hypothetical protein
MQLSPLRIRISSGRDDRLSLWEERVRRICPSYLNPHGTRMEMGHPANWELRSQA